ncbi:hypothetical protein JMA_16840 [Jeotgalibacillus malaysiensis]|uniref:Flagellar hook-length control protein-like C-terminal domain-containing protein n=1 Tax=Jeotgalibacillus malaysiensis TaxID=1508404 RepID=A0A0B5ALJ6_9BACL|nr:flagellar hook-length control protein FliK [Jeotgalibacillus malaysiensis]AJD91001.1 hypothetical protein JMA_16840 [Jeotgalibacillus malaysiensis]
MIGQITMQAIQPSQQLGSVRESSGSKNLFGAMLLQAGGSDFQINEAELSEIEVLMEQLLTAVESEDFSSFLKAAGEADPAVKQMFLLFDEKELMNLTVPELLLAAGVGEEIVEKAVNENISDPALLLQQILTGEAEDQPDQLQLQTTLAEIQQIAKSEQVIKSDQQPRQLIVHEDLAKLVLLSKGLSILDQKKTGSTEKNYLLQNVSEVMETIQTIFKNAVRDLEAPKQVENSKQHVLPEVIKSEQGILNLQSLQLQSGPVKWSLQQPLRQADPSQQLMEQFQQVMQKAGFGKVNGTEKLMIRLQPEHLGTLKIELLQKDGMMTARIVASTAVAKEMIDSQLNQLRQSFNTQNLQVDKIEVAQAETTENRLNKESDSQSREQREHQQSHDQEDNEEQSFQDIFLNIEV